MLVPCLKRSRLLFWNNKTVNEYSYMRGLDGKLPEKGVNMANSAEKQTDRKDKDKAAALIEPPAASSQKDYLRRLSSDLVESDKEKGVAAIGVLGSDVHDKIMILEALRQHFPHKLFFTTDLEAIYLHPGKWPQTHNLLVASAYDLKLRRELQGPIPPFRDSHQTAFFLATQIILNEGKAATDVIKKPSRTTLIRDQT